MGEGPAAEAAGGPVRETVGRVGEADPLLAGEAEEVAQCRQPEAAIAAGGEESLDVRARAGRPVAHAIAVKPRGERGEDREPLLNGVICQWQFADPAGAPRPDSSHAAYRSAAGRNGSGQRSIRRARRP